MQHNMQTFTELCRALFIFSFIGFLDTFRPILYCTIEIDNYILYYLSIYLKLTLTMEFL